MAILQLDDIWRIVGTWDAWEVQRFRGTRKNRQTGEPEERWDAEYYHDSLGQAVVNLARRQGRSADVHDYEALIHRTQALIDQYLEKLGLLEARGDEVGDKLLGASPANRVPRDDLP